MSTKLTNAELIHVFDVQLPALLERRPELEPRIYRAFMKAFATKEDVAAVLAELRGFRAETSENFEQADQRFEQVDQHFEQVDQRFEQVDQRFEQVDQRFEQVDQRFDKLEARVEDGFEQVDQRFEQVDQRFDKLETRVEDGFDKVQHSIDRLGGRWGIRNESVFRQTIAALLEESFGAQVEERHINGEQFDCIIRDGQHILLEITASVGPNIQDRLERKKRLYTEATGKAPTRVVLATASIHSRRAQILREAGFEVIEPEEKALVD